MTSWVQGNFKVLLYSWIVFSFAFGIYGNYFQLFLRGLGASDFAVGAAASLLFTASVIGYIIGSTLPDVYGRATVVRKATFFVSLPPLLYFLSPDYRWALAALAFEGFTAFYRPGLLALLQDSMPARHAGKGFALTHLTGFLGTPAPLIGGYFYSVSGVAGLKASMLVTFALAVGVSIYRYYALEETYKLQSETKPRLLSAAGASFQSFFRSFQLLDGNTKLLLVASFISDVGIIVVGAVFSLFLEDRHIVAKEFIGVFVSVALVVASVVSYLLGDAMDRYGRVGLLSFLTVAMAPVSMAVFLVTTNSLVLFLATVVGVGALNRFIQDYYKLKLFPMELRSRLNTLFLGATEVAGIFAGTLGGYLYSTSLTALFGFATLMLAASAGVFSRVVWKVDRMEKPVVSAARPL